MYLTFYPPTVELWDCCRKNIFWSTLYPNSNCSLCSNNVIDAWPHLLFTCSNLHIKGLPKARHNKVMHQITHSLQSNKHTRCCTLSNASNQNSRPQDITIPQRLLQCTCLAELKLDILCVLGAPIDNHHN